MENKQTSRKQGTCRNFVTKLWEFPSIDFFFAYFENIVKIILWKNFHDRIHNQIAVMLFSLFFKIFSNKLLYYVRIRYLVVLQWLRSWANLLLNLIVLNLIV